MKKLIILFCIFVLIFFSVSFTVSQINYKDNVIAEQTFVDFEDGFINNQGKTSVFDYGFYSSKNKGCGWIAAYNVCNYLGVDITIAKTIKKFDLYGTNLYSLLGTNPFAIIWFLNGLDINADISFNVDKFDMLARTSQVSILGYFSFEGGHYQMLVKGLEDNYTFYNPLQTQSLETQLSTLDDTLKILIYIK